MEAEGVVSPANHVGKREVLAPRGPIWGKPARLAQFGEAEWGRSRSLRWKTISSVIGLPPSSVMCEHRLSTP